MSLEQTVLSIIQGISHKPISLGLDIADHLLSGYTFTQIFLPHIQKSKKITLSFLGALPDIDILTFGLIKHRTLTHGYGFLAELSAITLAGRSSYGSKNALKYFLLASGFIGSHLLVDHFKTNEERFAYLLATGAALTGTVLYNKAKNRYTKKEKKYIIKKCIVTNQDGDIFQVDNTSDIKLRDRFTLKYNTEWNIETLKAWENAFEDGRATLYYIQEYKFRDKASLELVRELQKKTNPIQPDNWDKLDKIIDRYLNSIKNLWQQKIYKPN